MEDNDVPKSGCNKSGEDDRRSEGEICSDPDPESSTERKTKSLEKLDSRDSRDRRRTEKKKSRESSRSRSDKKHRRKKEKRRHRRRSSYSSGSSSRSRSRSKSRSWSRTRHRSGERHRNRRRNYDSHVVNDSDYDSDRWNTNKSRDTYKYQEPNTTIMVRGLALHLSELDIRSDLLKCGISVKDIRLIRHRDTGVSRGFAFVEFNTVKEASRWMDMKKGLLVSEDQSKAYLIYSVPKEDYVQSFADWKCTKCEGHNFKKRNICFKCGASRPEDQNANSNEFSSHPTSTIILSGLDPLTTEEKVLQTFDSNPDLASVPIRSVRIARESLTNMSLGHCYVEANNVLEGRRLFNALSKNPFEIDSRLVSIVYCKSSTFVYPSNNSIAATAVAAAQWTNSGATSLPLSSEQDEIERLAQHSAATYAKTPEEHASYLDYYKNYYRNKSTGSINQDSVVSTISQKVVASSSATVCYNSTTVAASVRTGVNTVLPGSQASRSYTDKKQTTSSKDVPGPNNSRFHYDKSCGYYYDPVSQLYYDNNSHYFYDSKKQQFLSWNSDEQRYIPVKDKSVATSTIASSVDQRDRKKNCDKLPEKKDKVKIAKKISQEMEKWAKTLNQKKELARLPTTIDRSTFYPPEQQKYEPVDTNTINSNTRNSSAYQLKMSTALPESITKLSLMKYDDNIGTEESKLTGLVDPSNSSFADYVKMTCLLCKRQFPNTDVLEKHMNLSDLHKQNLDKYFKEVSSIQCDNTGGFSGLYRDRAKERRTKYEPDPKDATNSLKDFYVKRRKDTRPGMYEEAAMNENIIRILQEKEGYKCLGRTYPGNPDSDD